MASLSIDTAGLCRAGCAASDGNDASPSRAGAGGVAPGSRDTSVPSVMAARRELHPGRGNSPEPERKGRER